MIEIKFVGPVGDNIESQTAKFEATSSGHLKTIVDAILWLKEQEEHARAFDQAHKEGKVTCAPPTDNWAWFNRYCWLWERDILPHKPPILHREGPSFPSSRSPDRKSVV